MSSGPLHAPCAIFIILTTGFHDRRPGIPLPPRHMGQRAATTGRQERKLEELHGVGKARGVPTLREGMNKAPRGLGESPQASGRATAQKPSGGILEVPNQKGPIW